MAWTTPRTWTDAEVPTAAEFQAELHDNLLILKTTRDAYGRINVLDGSNVANLDGTALTGLAQPGQGNAYTAGRNRFNQGAAVRFILPVGTAKYTGNKATNTAAGIWVDGTYLHHIADDGATEWKYLGTLVGACAGIAGSAWVAGSYLHYVDASGNDRYVEFKGSTSRHSDAAALGGSAWVNTYVRFVAEAGTTEVIGHADVTHSDHSDHNDHTDHTDNGPHTDHSDHTDVIYYPHQDHTDYTDHDDMAIHLHTGGHDDHTDHGDTTTHGDTGTHYDYSDHGDATPHGDVTADSRPVAGP